jgi:hypothetical protein
LERRPDQGEGGCLAGESTLFFFCFSFFLFIIVHSKQLNVNSELLGRDSKQGTVYFILRLYNLAYRYHNLDIYIYYI